MMPKEGLFYYEEITAKDLENIKNLKEAKYICSFSAINLKNYEKLMWAHYANGSKGIKIKFSLIKNTAKKVSYIKKDKRKIYNNIEAIKYDLDTIKN
ncbi:hypothetical protein [Campylobacter sp.]|uniref:hypothetical protein n=1 Tax=Campylobacter sp. TaxID=205 RepID=UPI0025BB3BCA|nr:hypothetical protein [Campylobacter sp.]